MSEVAGVNSDCKKGLLGIYEQYSKDFEKTE